MADKKKIKKHSDTNFSKGFRRYCLASHIVETNSWEEFNEFVKKWYEDEYDDIMLPLFKEFKLSNCILMVEYLIVDRLNKYLVENKKIKNWELLKEKFIQKVKINHRIDVNDAKMIITEETENVDKRMLTPHMMLYVAGYGLGELVNYVDEFTKKFPNKKEIVAELTKFNKRRGLIAHNLCSSREDINLLVNDGIIISKKLEELVDNTIEQTENK